MSEQKKIPAPILDNLAKAAERDLVEAEKEREEAALKRVIADLEGKLTAKRADLATAGRERAEAADNAGHYRDMAWGRAAHLEIPKGLMEVAEQNAKAAAAPAPPEYGPNDVRRWERENCPRCGQLSVRDVVTGGSWVHEATGLFACQVPAPEDPLGLDQTGALPLPPKEVAR